MKTKRMIAVTILIIIIAMLLLAIVPTSCNGCVLGDACDRPILATSRAIDATLTSSARYLHIQLTEMAK